MTDAPLGSTTSSDNKSWSAFKNIVNGYSDYGLAMTVFRGELCGIMTQTVQYPKFLFANKYTPGSGWNSSWISVRDDSWRAQGRVSLTTLNDRLFMLWRSSLNGVYLAWTYDLKNWTFVGRVGSADSTSIQSPAVAAYQGKLICVGLGPDKAMYWCSRDSDGGYLTGWTKIGGTYSESGLELCVHRNNLYLLHRGGDSKAFYSQTFTDGNWSAATKVVANLDTGIGAASLVDGTMIASYRGDRGALKYNIFTEGSGWGPQQTVSGAYMKLQPGAASFNGLTFISYARAAGPTSVRGYVDRPLIMDEKAAHTQVDEVDQEWECKWDESSSSGQKGWVRKMLCM